MFDELKIHMATMTLGPHLNNLPQSLSRNNPDPTLQVSGVPRSSVEWPFNVVFFASLKDSAFGSSMAVHSANAVTKFNDVVGLSHAS